MPQYSRLESRRGRRRRPSAGPAAAIAGAVVVIVLVGLGAFWWVGAMSKPHSSQVSSGSSTAASSSVATGASSSGKTTPAAGGATPPATTAQDSNADPAVAEAAKLSVSAAEKAAVSFPGAPSVSATEKSYNHLSPKHKYIAITLDDGYNYQPALLELFKQYDVHCTTFLVGSWAASHKAELQAMKDAGFEIGNHSWSHPFLTHLSSAAVADELTKAQRVITSVTGVQAPYLRPPFGATNPSVKATAARLGYHIVMWDRTFGDSGRGATPAKLYSNVVYSNGGVKPGDIILCHWGSKPSYEALKKILPDLRAQGFQFVTISALIADSR